MILNQPRTIKTDVLVIGGGGAGLRAAIEARRAGKDVVLASQSRAGYGNNTAISMAMWAASGGDREPRDNPLVHLKDTVVSGCYLNNQYLAEVMARGAWQQVGDLEAMGVQFKKSEKGVYIMAVPGHSYARHVTANRTLGVEFSGPMRQYGETIGVRFLDGVEIASLLVSGGEAYGTLGLNGKGDVFIIWAGATVLASGGAGEVFLRTNNADGSTGDGFALCYENNLPLVDMELVQFYPTTMGKFGQRLWAYEVILGRGATLRNSLGEDVLLKHNLRDFMVMTRDKLARAIMKEILAGNGIDGTLQVDLRTVPAEKMEKVLGVLKTQRYPEKAMVAPAAHFFMGGVMIDRECRTAINRLLAAGEVCGGVHGANRLAGNALTEVWVFGAIAGRQAAELGPGREMPVLEREALDKLKALANPDGPLALEDLRTGLRTAMWEKAGIVRTEQSLNQALEALAEVRQGLPDARVADAAGLVDALKLKNMLIVSEMVSRSALLRTESRGSHYRTDYPERNDRDWLKNIIIQQKSGQMGLTTKPVEFPLVARPQP